MRRPVLRTLAMVFTFGAAGLAPVSAGVEYGSITFGLKDGKPTAFVCHDAKTESAAVSCSRKGLKEAGGDETKYFSWSCKGWIAGAASGKKVGAAWCKNTKAEAEEAALKKCGSDCTVVLSLSDRK